MFDLDDTILEYDVSSDGAWHSIASEFADKIEGFEMDRFTAALREFRDWYWGDPERHRRVRLDLRLSRREVVRGAFAAMDLPHEPAASVLDEFADSYTIKREEAVKPFAGAIETLSWVRGLGVRTALVTNGTSEMQRGKVERFGLAQYFDYILIEGEFGVGKPEEHVYRHTLDRLETAPADAWMVGDNLEWEVAAPQRLGIRGVWVDSRGTGLPEPTTIRPDDVIDTLPDLVDLWP